MLYSASGALPEYCKGFGLSFDGRRSKTRLLDMHDRYTGAALRMTVYPNDAARMCRAYELLFLDLVARRDDYLARTRGPADARTPRRRIGWPLTLVRGD